MLLDNEKAILHMSYSLQKARQDLVKQHFRSCSAVWKILRESDFLKELPQPHSIEMPHTVPRKYDETELNEYWRQYLAACSQYDVGYPTTKDEYPKIVLSNMNLNSLQLELLNFKHNCKFIIEYFKLRDDEYTSESYHFLGTNFHFATGKNFGFNDFNKEIITPGSGSKYVREQFPDGCVGIRVDDDFWIEAVLPYKFKDLETPEIIEVLWPHFLSEAIYNRDVIIDEPQNVEHQSINESVVVYAEIFDYDPLKEWNEEGREIDGV